AAFGGRHHGGGTPARLHTRRLVVVHAAAEQHLRPHAALPLRGQRQEVSRSAHATPHPVRVSGADLRGRVRPALRRGAIRLAAGLTGGGAETREGHFRVVHGQG